jgi:hypothetical protein
MNHKLLQMLNEAGFEFTPDVMNKLPLFEKLVELEREACAKVAESYEPRCDTCPSGVSNAIRARREQ